MPFQKYLFVADILFPINYLVKTGDRMNFILSLVLIRYSAFECLAVNICTLRFF